MTKLAMYKGAMESETIVKSDIKSYPQVKVSIWVMGVVSIRDNNLP